ncbi:MAG: DUF262 domain-containing protein [Hyphomicrobium sp.]|uniref:GmrSD restriction endonuclease domain-containing protein n=1 Tax=Hyphomicrobium sp. TaxID=82 RepID=UPI003D0B8400
MPFDSPDVNLGTLLADVTSGKTQLPDFQREWKWDANQIASLLASISLGHPVGVIMMLEVGGEGVNFQPRTIAGVTLSAAPQPEQLILDGQQRLTSLYQSLSANQPVDTKDPRGKKLRRWYYVDMKKALDDDADREEAIVAVPEDRTVRDDFGRNLVADYSSIEKECAAEFFPLNRIFDFAAVNAWMVAYLKLDQANMAPRLERWNRFNDLVVRNFQSYTVPVIILKKETPREAVCTVFEKVNTGGVPLNVFELLTATFASDHFRLNDDWKKRKERLAKHPVLRSFENTDFLQAVTLLATRERRRQHLGRSAETERAPGISCKRKEILRLRLDEYEAWAEPVTEALQWAASFLADQRIFQSSDVPYRTQLVPLSAIRVAFGPRAGQHGLSDKLKQWYWCGVLGELYGGTTETRFARDLGDVEEWLNGGPTPLTVNDASFNPARLLTLRTRNSAAYKGIYALLLRDGARDWLYDQAIDVATFFNQKLDIHHIFPKAWCLQHHIDPDRRESIVNKTALSFVTNRAIGGKAPKQYLPILEKKAQVGADKLDAFVARHRIDPTHLRNDNFDGFFAARSAALLELIEAAMGKPILRETAAAPPEEYEEEPDELEDEVPQNDAVAGEGVSG